MTSSHLINSLILPWNNWTGWIFFKNEFLTLFFKSVSKNYKRIFSYNIISNFTHYEDLLLCLLIGILWYHCTLHIIKIFFSRSNYLAFCLSLFARWLRPHPLFIHLRPRYIIFSLNPLLSLPTCSLISNNHIPKLLL